MKKATSITCLLLFALVLLCGCAVPAASAAQEDPELVVATVGEEKIYLADLREMFEYYAEGYGIDLESEDSTEMVESLRDLVLDMLIDTEVQRIQARELGFYDLSDEQMAEAEQGVEDTLASWREYYTQIIQSEEEDISEEDLEARLDEEIAAAFEEMGISETQLLKTEIDNIALTQLYDTSVADATVSDDEVHAQYDAYVEEDKAAYSEDAAAFESLMMNGSEAYYTPAGFRYIKHILITISDEAREEYNALTADGDTAGAQAVLDEALSEIREEAEHIRQLLLNVPANIDDLIAEYSDDPGSAYMPDGYIVSATEDTGNYVEEFSKAARALESIGDISELVPVSYGYHILLYAGDLPAGAINFEEVRADIYASLLDSKQTEMFNALCEQWREELEISIDEEVLAQL